MNELVTVIVTELSVKLTLYFRLKYESLFGSYPILLAIPDLLSAIDIID